MTTTYTEDQLYLAEQLRRTVEQAISLCAQGLIDADQEKLLVDAAYTVAVDHGVDGLLDGEPEPQPEPQPEPAKRSFTFNTGRQYAHDGQPIEVTQLDAHGDNYRFVDHARCIIGYVTVPRGAEMSERELASEVLGRYDHNNYRLTED